MKALEIMAAKCSTDAQRVALFREALEIAESEAVEAVVVERQACALMAHNYGRIWGEGIATQINPGSSTIPSDEIADAILARTP
jgi:hypothetical protein